VLLSFFQFANCVRLLIQQPTTQTEPAVLEVASKALGHLARSGGALTVDFVEFNIKQSLEWLHHDKSDKKRLAAVLVLKGLCVPNASERVQTLILFCSVQSWPKTRPLSSTCM
jgi:hypothetical protein